MSVFVWVKGRLLLVEIRRPVCVCMCVCVCVCV